MIGVIVHHYARPGQEANAKRLIQANGKAMRAFPGFVGRYTLVGQDNPSKISTVTVWEAGEDRERWTASEERKKNVAGAGELWTTPPEAESFDVIPEP